MNIYFGMVSVFLQSRDVKMVIVFHSFKPSGFSSFTIWYLQIKVVKLSRIDKKYFNFIMMYILAI